MEQFATSRRQFVSRELPSYLGKLRTFCTKLTRNGTAVDDLVQATCLRALERAVQFEPRTHLDKWICTIARSLWLNEQRSLARSPNDILPIDSVELPSHDPSAESRCFGSEMLDIICKLPSQERMAVYLIYMEDMPLQHVATKMGISMGTVYNRLSLARLKLSEDIRSPIVGQ